jgi:hypothetical protein
VSNEDSASICCGVSPEGRWSELRRVQRMGVPVRWDQRMSFTMSHDGRGSQGRRWGDMDHEVSGPGLLEHGPDS